MNVLVTGAGGFIGGWLVKDLLDDGHRVRAVDVKPISEWDQQHLNADNWDHTDLKHEAECYLACSHQDQVFNLAADMGGMGFIETHKAACMLSVLISTNMLVAARDRGVHRFFYSSSACVYAADKQTSRVSCALREPDAYPAMPEDGYGWEKLFTERMCRHFTEDFGLETRVARFHNVYGPKGTFEGVRAKAPAAICRKVAEAKLKGLTGIDIWGDGYQSRSFMYVDDCISGIRRIMDSNLTEPINLGSAELVTINELVAIVEDIAGVALEHTHDLSAPQGVRGRNSDNAMILNELGWQPSISLRSGLERTYRWIFSELSERG